MNEIVKKFKENDYVKQTIDFLKKPKVQWVITLVLLFLIVFVSAQVRVSNLDLLKDETTGEYIPLALDPHYFLRVSETLYEQGELPSYDSMRYSPGYETAWSGEIMPNVIVSMFKLFNPVFGGTLAFYNVISPVVFFILGSLIFFSLIYVLTKKKSLALLSCLFLAFNPAYLYRTMAGFSDHESIGMVGFFLAILLYSLFLMKLEKKKKWKYAILGGLFAGFGTALTMASWGGVANFLFIIIPLSFFLYWLSNNKEDKKKSFLMDSVFYIGWIMFTLIFALILGQGFRINNFLTSSNIVSFAVLFFILVDGALFYLKPKFIKEKFRVLYSCGSMFVLGFTGLFLIGRNPFSLIVSIIRTLIAPFSRGDRLGLTVAENAQPFLQDWISNVGSTYFWLFLLGSFLLGIYLSRNLKNKNKKYSFSFFYILMIVGIVFSKYSSTSIFNGNNFISQAFYILSLLSFWVYFFYLQINEEFNWKTRDTVMFALVFYVIISGRAASRVFFAIIPFISFIGAFLIVELFYEWKKSKDEVLKIILIALFFLVLVFGTIATINAYQAISNSAKVTSPSANSQWQNAMSWVRENTTQDAVFSHWWDYGYWVETLGNRRTVADGGHFQTEYGNHNIGRYLLTTDNPETAYSYFKTMEVSHLLIDSTDLGKYGAYSKIGSDEEWDRLSYISIGTYNPSQVQETANEIVYIYNIQTMVDEDIIYLENNQSIFLPGPSYDNLGSPTPKSYLIGIVFRTGGDQVKQPEAVFYYNNNQIKIPLRYLFFGEQLYDFKNGLEATAYILPSLNQNQYGTSIDPLGSVIYLSPNVNSGLFAQLYLLDDAYDNYEEMNLVHEEYDPVVKMLKAQGADFGEFIFYGGLRGPIKIWETGYSENTQVVEEFRRDQLVHCYGCLDEKFE